MAVQDQALRTNHVKHRIDKQDVSPMCRLCRQREGAISHVVAECSILAQKQYKYWRHDRAALIIHIGYCTKDWVLNITRNGTEGVLENDTVKILWDFTIQPDHKIDHNKPDITVHGKQKRECVIIDE